MARWKYNPRELARKALDALLKFVSHQWTNVVKT
jgi:hypothetical protein